MKKNIIYILILAAVCLISVFTVSKIKAARETSHKGFEIQIKDKAGWMTVATVGFALPFEEKTIDISKYLPDADGQYKIRIKRGSEGAAHLDDVILDASGKKIKLTRAVEVETNTDVTKKLLLNDNDVINAHGKTIEITFASPRKETSALSLDIRGREEIVDKLPGGPCGYPETDFFTYDLNHNFGSLAADGSFTPEDKWGKPVFKTFTKPVTGHPDGYTYGYLKNDKQYLYGAVDFTSDNTYDGDADFSAIIVKTKEGEKKFRVSVKETKYGNPGFTYTDKVGYQHKIYEFKIPLSEIETGVTSNGELQVKFLAYGTSACPPPLTLSLGAGSPAAGTGFLGNSGLSQVMMQLGLHDVEATVWIQDIYVTGEGTGHEVNDVESVKLYHDVNDDGALDSGDVLLGSGTFPADNGIVQLTVAPTNALPVGVPNNQNALIVYDIKNTAPKGSTFKAKVVLNTDVTLNAGAPCAAANISGAPVEGNLITVSYGSSTAAVGQNNPASTEVDAGRLDVSMLQIAVTAGPEEPLDLTSIKITDSGGGLNASAISAVRLWEDADGGGTVTVGDIQINTDQTFTQNTSTLTLTATTASQIAAGATKNYLVTYNFAPPSIASIMPFNRLYRAASMWAKAVLAPLAYPLALSGCGGGSSATTASGSSLSGAPAGFVFTDAAGNTITSAAAGDLVQLRNAVGLPILQFTMGTSAVNLDGALLVRNAFGTLVALNPPSAIVTKAVSGLGDDITVFVPCGTEDDLIRACPNESQPPTSAPECSGELRLTGLSASSGGYTWDNTDRTGTDDCQVTGAPALFNSFYAEGLDLNVFKASIAAASDIVLTGANSQRTINPGSFSAEGGEITLATP